MGVSAAIGSMLRVIMAVALEKGRDRDPRKVVTPAPSSRTMARHPGGIVDVECSRRSKARAERQLPGIDLSRPWPTGPFAEGRVLQVDPGITPAATESAVKESASRSVSRSAVNHWRFVPATRDGAAVAAWYLVHVQYQPGRQPAEDLATRR